MYEKKLTILIADDELNDRRLIKSWISRSIDMNKIQVIECEEWQEAVDFIRDAKDDPIDLVFTDIVFENQENGFLGGQHITEAAILQTKTRVVLVSKNWNKAPVLKLIGGYPGKAQALPKNPDLSVEEFEAVFVPFLKNWCAYEASKLNFSQREGLKKMIHSAALTGEEMVDFGNDTWRLKFLYPHLSWSPESAGGNYREIAGYLIHYPFVDKESWHSPREGNNFYVLPIMDYYQELYFNPIYQGKLSQIEKDTMTLIVIMLRCFVGDVLHDDNKRKEARRMLADLSVQSDLITSYKVKLNGRNYAGQISESVMGEFVHKLTGRLAAIGGYLFFDFTRERIENVLINGHFSEEGGDNARQLFSEYFFILNTASESGSKARYKKYQDIYCACSDDERSILKTVWQKIQEMVDTGLGLNAFEKELVTKEWGKYMDKSLKLNIACADHPLVTKAK